MLPWRYSVLPPVHKTHHMVHEKHSGSDRDTESVHLIPKTPLYLTVSRFLLMSYQGLAQAKSSQHTVFCSMLSKCRLSIQLTFNFCFGRYCQFCRVYMPQVSRWLWFSALCNWNVSHICSGNGPPTLYVFLFCRGGFIPSLHQAVSGAFWNSSDFGSWSSQLYWNIYWSIFSRVGSQISL